MTGADGSLAGVMLKLVGPLVASDAGSTGFGIVESSSSLPLRMGDGCLNTLQIEQSHSSFVFVRFWKTSLDILMHVLCFQVSHWSHWMPSLLLYSLERQTEQVSFLTFSSSSSADTEMSSGSGSGMFSFPSDESDILFDFLLVFRYIFV